VSSEYVQRPYFERGRRRRRDKKKGKRREESPKKIFLSFSQMKANPNGEFRDTHFTWILFDSFFTFQQVKAITIK